MILQNEAGGIGGLAEAAGDAAVGVAGSGVAGGMVVDEDEGVGVVNEHLSEQVTRMGDAFVEAALKASSQRMTASFVLSRMTRTDSWPRACISEPM